MIRYIKANDLNQYPRLRDSMFRDRADQFHTRLGWVEEKEPDTPASEEPDEAG